MKQQYFRFIKISNLLFIIIFFFIPAEIFQLMGSILICILNIIVLFMAFLAKPCRKYKYWGIATIIIQVIIVLIGIPRDKNYTEGFKASQSKPILFVKSNVEGGSAPFSTITIKTVYQDGTVHWFTKETHENAAFWVRQLCDSMTVKWEVSSDTTNNYTPEIIFFNLKNHTYSVGYGWGDNSSISNINWDLLHEIARKENNDSSCLSFDLKYMIWLQHWNKVHSDARRSIEVNHFGF